MGERNLGLAHPDALLQKVQLRLAQRRRRGLPLRQRLVEGTSSFLRSFRRFVHSVASTDRAPACWNAATSPTSPWPQSAPPPSAVSQPPSTTRFARSGVRSTSYACRNPSLPVAVVGREHERGIQRLVVGGDAMCGEVHDVVLAGLGRVRRLRGLVAHDDGGCAGGEESRDALHLSLGAGQRRQERAEGRRPQLSFKRIVLRERGRCRRAGRGIREREEPPRRVGRRGRSRGIQQFRR